MCLSSTRRPVQATARRAIDASLLERVAAKQNGDYAQPSLDMSAFEPNPIVTEQTQNGPVDQHSKHPHIIVQHNYHDHSHDNRADYQEEHPARGGVTTPFPLKLHEMLDGVVSEGLEHIVSWQPHGRCFVVHKPKEFVELLPKYFKLSKLASFQRQLNLYGFQRLTRGRDRGGYYHELFLRGKVFLAHNIQRIKVKGTGVRARSNPDQEPDFWAMPWVQAGTQAEAPVAAAPPQAMISQIPNMFKDEQDIVCAFGNKTFHYLDPFQPMGRNAKPRWANAGVDELLTTEAASFFEDFHFPENIGAEIENDAVFGDMLERMIA